MRDLADAPTARQARLPRPRQGRRRQVQRLHPRRTEQEHARWQPVRMCEPRPRARPRALRSPSAGSSSSTTRSRPSDTAPSTDGLGVELWRQSTDGPLTLSDALDLHAPHHSPRSARTQERQQSTTYRKRSDASSTTTASSIDDGWPVPHRVERATTAARRTPQHELVNVKRRQRRRTSKPDRAVRSSRSRAQVASPPESAHRTRRACTMGPIKHRRLARQCHIQRT
jgi:hypothetical protein